MLKVNILGIELDNLGLEDILKLIEDFISNGIPRYIVTPNVDHLILRRKDIEFEEAYKNASLIVPDGVPLLWASRFLGSPLMGRVNGTDLFLKISELSAKKGYGIFLLGAEEGVAEKTAMVLRDKYPNLRIAGTYSPYFGFEKDRDENEKIVHLIRESHPDILFTSLGSPKGEKWIYRYYKSLGVPLSLNVGASFDFVSGRVKRAPIWMQRNGLEWLWRLFKEPGRLWRRYLIRDIGFFYLVFRQRFIRKV
jgi:N-acetylglucosaminyldiphosphoundecaprenol N-acetyl-beta-D-mannosaminyltransferase